ncbi:hypothetical protein H6F96_07265 [Microcoleus sp. FACHB-53]|jgi:hypothetical protein|nr:hypothetical protein [Microcoleus sp. FACHB-53]
MIRADQDTDLVVHKDLLINTYIPIAKTWVAEEDGTLASFISLLENNENDRYA